VRSAERLAAKLLGLTAVLAGATIAKAGTIDGADPHGPKHAGLNAQQAMLWKYTARCALRSDQELEAPAGPDGDKPKFKGSLGLADSRAM